MQPFFLRLAALATTIPVLCGGASKISQLSSPLKPPINGPTIVSVPLAFTFTHITARFSVPSAFDIPTQSDTILTVGGTTLANAPKSWL